VSVCVVELQQPAEIISAHHPCFFAEPLWSSIFVLPLSTAKKWCLESLRVGWLTGGRWLNRFQRYSYMGHGGNLFFSLLLVYLFSMAGQEVDFFPYSSIYFDTNWTAAPLLIIGAHLQWS
jgi:hypothetical protein